MGFLSSLFVALCLQLGQPSLPSALAEQPELLAAWEVVQDPAAERETRLAQADTLLAAVVALPAPDQAPFLLDVLGNGSWPKPLHGAITALERNWPKFGDRLLEDLVLPMPERATRVRGAIRALGMLQNPRPDMVEGLASLLSREALASEARLSLTRLTGREFGGAKDFDQWWSQAKTLDRATWLENALRETQARELADWRSKLSPVSGAAVPPATVVAGMQHPRASVRSLAYRALVGLDASALPEAQTTALTEALRGAVQNENVAELRLELLPLVPRYLQNGEALASLLGSLEFGSAKEQLLAATNLQLVRPPRAAWDGLLRGLGWLYPVPEAAVPSEASVGAPRTSLLGTSTQEVRTALWTGLLAVGRQKDVIAEVSTDELKEILGRALVVEEVAVVRDRLFQAVGVYGDVSFLAVLQPLVALAKVGQGNPQLPARQVPPKERRAALAAMTAVAARGSDPGILVSLLPDLLADPEVLVRDQAIASVQRLKLNNGQALLAGRLEREGETPVLKRLLESLGKEPDARVLQAVLDFQPPLALRDVYVKTVQVQVAGDFPSLEKAYIALSARLDWQSTFALVRKFSHDGLEAEQAAQLDRLYAQSESEHLLEVGVENEFQGYADEAVGLLRVLMTREPTDLRWPVYFVELQLMRGAVDEALTLMRTLVPHLTDAAGRWGLGLDTLRFAAAQEELWDSARALLADLDASGNMPAALEYRAEQIRQMFPPVEATEAEPIKGDEGIAPVPDQASTGEKPPVKQEEPDAEGGGQEQPKNEVPPTAEDPGADPPKSEEPAKEEPVKEETPAEEPDGTSNPPVEEPSPPEGGGF